MERKSISVVCTKNFRDIIVFSIKIIDGRSEWTTRFDQNRLLPRTHRTVRETRFIKREKIAVKSKVFFFYNDTYASANMHKRVRTIKKRKKRKWKKLIGKKVCSDIVKTVETRPYPLWRWYSFRRRRSLANSIRARRASCYYTTTRP